MANYLITVAGKIVAYSGESIVLKGSTVICGQMVEQFDDESAAAKYYSYLIDKMVTAGITNDLRGPFISAVNPSPFNVVTSVVTVRGKGFSKNTVGKLYVEDESGGQDSNGYYLNCTFVDENTLTAFYGSAGDTLLAVGNCLVYYQDSNNVLSNILYGTVDADLTVTF